MGPCEGGAKPTAGAGGVDITLFERRFRDLDGEIVQLAGRIRMPTVDRLSPVGKIRRPVGEFTKLVGEFTKLAADFTKLVGKFWIPDDEFSKPVDDSCSSSTQ